MKSVIVGAEYDVALFNRLKVLLRDIDGVIIEQKWGVGGSQKLGSLEVKIGSESVKIESETYIGLSVSGPDALVNQIIYRLEKRE